MIVSYVVHNKFSKQNLACHACHALSWTKKDKIIKHPILVIFHHGSQKHQLGHKSHQFFTGSFMRTAGSLRFLRKIARTHSSGPGYFKNLKIKIKIKMRHILNVLTTSKENDHIIRSLVVKEIFNFFLEIQVFVLRKINIFKLKFLFLNLKIFFFFFFFFLVEGDISHLRQLQKSLFKSISPTF
jgi:hypothetical protein